MRTELAMAPISVAFDLIATPDLGDSSYVVSVGGAAVAVDVQRDIDRVERVLDGLPLLAVFETHIHNDYVTGGHLLADGTGARYVLPSNTGSRLPHEAASDGDVFPIEGGWLIRAVHTPGHTPNHTSYQLEGPSGPVAIFTGGSMLAGAVGRTDLISPDMTEELARAQYRSVNRLADNLPDPAVVAPTHGAGSFCSASAVSDTTSTIELERGRNPALLATDEDGFVASQIAGLMLHPSYYRHMAPSNKIGVEPLDMAGLPEVSPEELESSDAEIIDLRPAKEWAAGHIPGSLGVPARLDTGQYLGWVREWNTPLVLVGSAEDVAMVRLQLARIGYDAVVGAVGDSLAAWSSSGRQLAKTKVVDFSDIRTERPDVLLDVRDPVEVRDGALDGAIATHVSRIPEEAASLPDGDIWTYCRTGFRATIAAGFMERAGKTPVIVIDDWDPNGMELSLARSTSSHG